MASKIRERIISTSWKLFREKGFGETTINDIINKANISKGSFYYYFRSKDDLLGTLSEILDREYERLEKEEPAGMGSFDKLLWLNYEVHRRTSTTGLLRICTQRRSSRRTSQAFLTATATITDMSRD